MLHWDKHTPEVSSSENFGSQPAVQILTDSCQLNLDEANSIRYKFILLLVPIKQGNWTIMGKICTCLLPIRGRDDVSGGNGGGGGGGVGRPKRWTLMRTNTQY